MPSLADIKEKEVKGKKNALPRLTNILGDPHKKHWPLLREDELQQFRNMLQAAIALSGQTPREFAKSKSLRIGLESSLRAINNCQASCVLISLSLKPHYVIGLVARNMEAKDATVPVYAQPKLEDLTQQLLGIRALILVLPKNASTLSTDLGNWVTARTKQPIAAKPIPVLPTKQKRKASTPPIDMPAEAKKPALAGPAATLQEDKPQFRADFISFAAGEATVEQPKATLQDGKAKLTAVLNEIAEVAKLAQKPEQAQLSSVEAHDEGAAAAETESLMSVNDADTDDFITGKYKPLTVLHLTPNPNKAKRKRKNNNRNKNKKNKNKQKTQ